MCICSRAAMSSTPPARHDSTDTRISCTTDDNAPANRRRVSGARCHSNSNSNNNSSGRTVFSRTQLDAMEDRFVRQSFLTREERIELADEIQLTERQILIWFQNRR